jgi:hypothetical protein
VVHRAEKALLGHRCELRALLRLLQRRGALLHLAGEVLLRRAAGAVQRRELGLHRAEREVEVTGERVGRGRHVHRRGVGLAGDGEQQLHERLEAVVAGRHLRGVALPQEDPQGVPQRALRVREAAAPEPPRAEHRADPAAALGEDQHGLVPRVAVRADQVQARSHGSEAGALERAEVDQRREGAAVHLRSRLPVHLEDPLDVLRLVEHPAGQRDEHAAVDQGHRHRAPRAAYRPVGRGEHGHTSSAEVNGAARDALREPSVLVVDLGIGTVGASEGREYSAKDRQGAPASPPGARNATRASPRVVGCVAWPHEPPSTTRPALR